ncbi:U3 small nucleolar RNA-associated protein 6-domain-containing protein [Fimicolochytrium jonesii]|uniref:U3 small nucleolar RNA-associated protein 6-domain-containing protein n=1 Tax=Fimicolochytrium jonesii TaxID=1396493 RepID=UPI0022FED028|nr:U3 small nucleolar RNA-associated protein 6-domain-containing protein [Fimicolochytrium jonesii]KAI8820189.1 U3 small nucleolar RNA-associated protein 6-domain-containing protein [Fimicolochytrium jonesii]
MAEQVQYHLEKMVPELEDLQERGIFQPHEIKAIVKQRTTHEYRVHRIIPLKADFLRYIAYEENLERLRRKRKQRLGMDKPPTAQEIELGIKTSGLSDYSITRRIHGLYDKMLKRFAGDLTLWIQYFDWCRASRSSKALGKVFARAIQLHPTYDVFWIMAAAWEFEDNTNMSSARVLLQRGLRINPESKKLWMEYFKLELLWVQKIKERRKVLFKTGEGAVKEAQATAAPQVESVDLPDLKEEAGLSQSSLQKDTTLSASAKEGSSSDTAPMLASKLSASQEALLKTLIPRAIYRNAIQTIPNDLDFRLSFLKMYEEFPETTEGQKELLDTLERDFGRNAMARGVLAERPLYGVKSDSPAYPAALKAAVTAFQAAVEDLANPEVYGVYAVFLQRQYQLSDEPNLKLYLSRLLSKVFAQAESTNNVSEELYIQWTLHVEDSDSESPSVSVDVLGRGLERIPTSGKLWLLLIPRLPSNERSSIVAAYEKATRKVTDPDALAQVWTHYLSFVTMSISTPTNPVITNTSDADSDDDDQSDDSSTSAILLDPTHKQNLFNRALASFQHTRPAHEATILDQYLTFAHRVGGITAVRRVAKHLSQIKTRPKRFWATWAQLETDELREMEKGDGKRGRDREDGEEEEEVRRYGAAKKGVDYEALEGVRRVWEGLVGIDEKDADSWLLSIKFELQTANDLDRAAALYWKAEKSIRPADKQRFEEMYQKLKDAL